MLGEMGDAIKVPKDILSFEAVLTNRKKLFLERRERYGNHLDNTIRFPLESLCGLYLKMCRQMRDIEKHIPIDILNLLNEDTLQDLGNYDDLILSSRSQNNEKQI